jgi:putative heme iron utilization protein
VDGGNVAAAARGLIDGARWLAVATIGPEGEPAVSYIPFAVVSGGFGIVVSALAAHTNHLTAHPKASVLVVDDRVAETDSFSRARLSIVVEAKPVTDEKRANAIWDAVATLRQLPDFRAFVLEPIRARLVLGFAQASDLTGADVLFGGR